MEKYYILSVDSFQDTFTKMDSTKVFSFEVLLQKGIANLPKDSKVKADQIRTIDKVRLIKKIGTIPTSYLTQINAAIQLHLDLV